MTYAISILSMSLSFGFLATLFLIIVSYFETGSVPFQMNENRA
jgi:hypothetical protein